MSGSDEFSNPKRWQPPKIKQETPGGSYQGGITNPEILMLFGAIMSSWTHVEEIMIDVIDLLVFVDHDLRSAAASKTRGHMPGRQIFRSIGANGIRAKLMRNLLSQFIGNYKKDSLYDEVISEFQSLVNLRNDYVHGLWWSDDKHNALLQKENVHEFSFQSQIPVTADELRSFLNRARRLSTLLGQIRIKEYELSEAKKHHDALAALSRKPQEPPA